MLRLSMLGWTQQEISDKLQELWPDAKRTSRESVKNFLLAEMPDSTKLPKGLERDIADGFSVRDIAKDRCLPEILVWGMKLKDVDDYRDRGHTEAGASPV